MAYSKEKEIANHYFGKAELALQYYFQRVWRAAGLLYDSDNDAEIGRIIEDIRTGVEHDILAKLKEPEGESNGN